MLDTLCKSLNLSNTNYDLSQITHVQSDEVDPLNIGVSSASKEKVWRSVEQLYKTGTQPAITVCIRKRGKVLINRSIGHAHGNGPSDDKRMVKSLATADMPVCLYSASKAVTAILMHKLAEQGAVNLDDTVSYYLPEFNRKGKGNITLQQILSHRGGIPALPKNLELEEIFDEDHIWELLCNSKPITVDGSKLAYHAITGGFVFQRIIQKAMGVSIQEYLDQHIRQPMNMKHFTYGLPKDQRENVASNYATAPNPPFPLSNVIKRALGASFPDAANLSNQPQWMDSCLPAANLYGTAEEISRFYQMLLNKGEWNGQQILQPETVKRATTAGNKFTFDRTLMLPMRYSQGLMLGANPVGMWGANTRNAFGHIGLINKMCWADPDRELSAAILTTGLALASHHIPYLMKLVHDVNKL